VTSLSAFLSLFTSLGTLFCCALPACFVLIGAGATFAGITQAVPGLLWFGEHKILTFSIGAVGNLVGLISLRRPTSTQCEVGGQSEASACDQTRSWSRRLVILSIGLYGIGFVFAFILF
jgi:hypothetical protein